MGRVFHIGRDNGGFAITDVTYTAPEVSAGPSSLRGQFGKGYDESAAHEALTQLPVPATGPSLKV